MRKVLLGLLALYGQSIYCHGQSGLYLSASTYFSVLPATTVSVDGLAITPAISFTINGPYVLERTNSIVHTAPQKHILRVFQFTNTSNPFSGDIAMYYQDSELNGIAEDALTLNTHNGSVWQYHPTSSRDGINNVVNTTGLSGIRLNEVTLADLAAPLPLNWGPVTANRKQKGVVVQWQTANETKVASFHVESSVDGKNWQVKSKSLPAHNTYGQHQYGFTDGAASLAYTLYRIRQTDADGQYTYSKIVTVNALQESKVVKVYPNPATENVTIQVPTPSITGIHLFDAKGHLLQQTSFTKVSRHVFQLDYLSKGIYFIKVLLLDGSFSYHQLLKH